MYQPAPFRSARPRVLHLLRFLLILAAAALAPGASPGIAAPAPCVTNLVGNQAELDAAIAVFNAEHRACHHRIVLSSDIILTDSTTPIDNNNRLTHAWLVIDGNGFSVQGSDDIQPISIHSGAVVRIRRIRITGVTDSYFNGGGIYNAGTLFLADSTVSGNKGLYGGGIYNSGTLTLVNSTVSKNRTHEDGGGIYNTGTLTVTRSTISDNYTGGPSDGGGIYNTGTLTVSFSTINQNDAVETGGGIYNEDGAVIVASSTIDHNGAGERGGGISNSGGRVFITNSTLSGNSGYFHGGGAIGNSGTLAITHSTLSGNSTEVEGVGGIANLGRLTLNNSIIANSVKGDCLNEGDGTVTAFSSLIEDTGDKACGLADGTNRNIIGVDPLLGKLKDNGGPTRTHALLQKSPAIDKGDNHLAVDLDGNILTTDQRGKGYPRIMPGSYSHSSILGRRVDIGAYEYFQIYLKIIR